LVDGAGKDVERGLAVDGGMAVHRLTSNNLTFPSNDLNRFNISIGWKITDSKLNR
jgi:hypothetical protein